MSIQSSLLSGAGNTFHIYYNVKDVALTSELAQKICAQFPADGVVFLKEPQAPNLFYTWDFYNNDGSPAEMCGNATRCVGYYVENILVNADKKIDLQTTAGLIQIQILGKHQYQVRMTTPHITPHSKLFVCNTGVPHVVIEIPSDHTFDQHKAMAKELRESLEFAPKGTNVTLIKHTPIDDVIEAVSYERGVEDFTQACGTGAVAAGLFMNIRYLKNKINIKMPGGTLIVDTTDRQQPMMTGPAEHLKDCIYELKT
jgi:diaminopimelate epimerase